MTKYIGKICPYCKTTFTEDDDIVVCSDCEMPHHKECWIENKGCTTFGCQGTIQGIDFAPDYNISSAPKYEVRDADQVSTTQNAFCGKCGAPIIAGNMFCSKCGTPVNSATSPQHTQTQTLKNITDGISGSIQNFMDNHKSKDSMDQELATYVGTNSKYYLGKFSTMKYTKQYSSWNTGAFFLSPFWCLYRKMYMYGGGLLAVYIIAALIGGVFGALITIAAAIVSGLYANYFYMFDVEQRITRGRSLPIQIKQQHIEQWSDINAIAPSIAAVVYVLIAVFRISRG